MVTLRRGSDKGQGASDEWQGAIRSNNRRRGEKGKRRKGEKEKGEVVGAKYASSGVKATGWLASAHASPSRYAASVVANESGFQSSET